MKTIKNSCLGELLKKSAIHENNCFHFKLLLSYLRMPGISGISSWEMKNISTVFLNLHQNIDFTIFSDTFYYKYVFSTLPDISQV